MNKRALYIISLLLVSILAAVQKAYCQDTTKISLPAASDFYKNIIWLRIQPPFEHLDHRPDEADEKNVENYSYLLNQRPDSNNYEQYYLLACSLWELGKIRKAERMFLRIIGSSEKHYAETEHYSSDIPGDSTSTNYDYGAFDYSYKNSAAIYLTKIYVERKKYRKAFLFLEDAINKYKTTYSCGTGYHYQQEECSFLYACIYEGQKQYDKVMDLLLPESLTRDDKIIARTIKRLYSKEQIKQKLQEAENTIQYKVDTELSYTYMGTGTAQYYSGRATITLFDRQVSIVRPEMRNGETVTREHFVREFRRSSFYRNLTGKDLL